MASRGYGCTSLQNLALKHKLKGEARRVFFKSGCVKCHDPDGKGLSEKNLGYVVTFKEILRNSKNPFP